MVDLGYNYRLSDIQCVLGTSQLSRLPDWIERRQAIAHRYDQAFGVLPGVKPLSVRPDVSHAYHLYVVCIDPNHYLGGRNAAYAALRFARIGVNVHYIPVHLQPFYRHRFGTGPGLCPVAESAYEQILSLPIFPRMSDEDVERVIRAVETVVRPHGTKGVAA
jgi:perosamine synthetase